MSNLKPGPVNPGLTMQQRFKAVGMGHCVWHIKGQRGFFFDDGARFRMLMRGGLQVGIDQHWWNEFLFSGSPQDWTIWGGAEPEQLPETKMAMSRLEQKNDD